MTTITVRFIAIAVSLSFSLMPGCGGDDDPPADDVRPIGKISAAGSAAPAQPSSATTPSTRPSGLGAAGAPAPMTPTVSDRIESVGFDDPTNRGEPVPVLLYQGGYANYDPGLVIKPIDIK